MVFWKPELSCCLYKLLRWSSQIETNFAVSSTSNVFTFTTLIDKRKLFFMSRTILRPKLSLGSAYVKYGVWPGLIMLSVNS